MPSDRWYFAYGSNLLVEQIEARIGCILQVIRSRLRGYCFGFTNRDESGQIYANIVPEPNGEVWGVVYLCDNEALEKMDSFEGVADGCYRRIPVTVELDSGERIEAIAYISGDEFVSPPGKPSDEYLDRILSGARHRGLPEEHIRMIENLAK
jgi:cation transport regulator ChaC